MEEPRYSGYIRTVGDGSCTNEVRWRLWLLRHSSVTNPSARVATSASEVCHFAKRSQVAAGYNFGVLLRRACRALACHYLAFAEIVALKLAVVRVLHGGLSMSPYESYISRR